MDELARGLPYQPEGLSASRCHSREAEKHGRRFAFETVALQRAFRLGKRCARVGSQVDLSGSDSGLEISDVLCSARNTYEEGWEVSFDRRDRSLGERADSADIKRITP